MARKINQKQNKNRSAKPVRLSRYAKPPARLKTAAETSPKTSRKTSRKNRTATAAKRADVIDTLVAASAQALSLPIDPAWRASIKRNLHVILKHAALVDQFSLPDDVEPAPVFRA
ncbi:MAG: DUF4089 domain-containing protein [Xanthobacteraceae bacterium]